MEKLPRFRDKFHWHKSSKICALVKRRFEFEGHHGLGDFAPQSSVTVEEKNCAPLASRLCCHPGRGAVPQIGPGRAENTTGIESGMLEETPCFHRKHASRSSLGIVEFMARRFSRELSNKLLRSSGSSSPTRRTRLYPSGKSSGLHYGQINNQSVLAAKIGFTRRANFHFGAVQDVAPRRPLHIKFAVAGAVVSGSRVQRS